MAIRERSFKYLNGQQVSQQIFMLFKSKFHNEGGVCEKSYFEFFSGNDPICHSQKFQPSQTSFFAYNSNILNTYQMSILADFFHWIFG